MESRAAVSGGVFCFKNMMTIILQAATAFFQAAIETLLRQELT
ncbi:MAG TPA: hypothetical protein VGC80_10525 [Acetobacteraceae bacterium]|jgi:hypothetical protein